MYVVVVVCNVVVVEIRICYKVWMIITILDSGKVGF